jgi:hypothetical protein
MTSDLGVIDKLEQENRTLKGEIGKLPGGRDALLKLRSITLAKENQTLSAILRDVSGARSSVTVEGHR